MNKSGPSNLNTAVTSALPGSAARSNYTLKLLKLLFICETVSEMSSRMKEKRKFQSHWE